MANNDDGPKKKKSKGKVLGIAGVGGSGLLTVVNGVLCYFDKGITPAQIFKFLNLKSVYLPSKAAVAQMLKTGGGSIINISSVGGIFPDMSRLAYGISKSAINFLTKNIAVQYARNNIRCNAVLPGFVATDAAMEHMSEDFLKMFLKNVPLNRPATPEDIANAVLFFASDNSSFITGETMPVAGGFGLPSPMYSQYMDMGVKRG